MKISFVPLALGLVLTVTTAYSAPVVVVDGDNQYLVADNGLVSDIDTAVTDDLPVDTNEDHYSEIGFNGQDVGDAVPDSWNGDRRWGNNGEDTVATWEFEGLVNGTYNVYASWRNEPQGNLSFAQYSMTDGGPTVELDQRIGTIDQSELTLFDGERDIDFAILGLVTILDGDLVVTVDDSVTGPDDATTFIHADAIAIGPLPNALPGDFDENGTLDAADIDLLSAEVRAGTNNRAFDLNDDQAVDEQDRTVWVNGLKNTWFGDANLDGKFNSGDLVVVLASGAYEIDTDSVWSTGDFNGDQRTNAGDLIVALSGGGYEAGERPATSAVPEPSALALLVVGLTAMTIRRQRSH